MKQILVKSNVYFELAYKFQTNNKTYIVRKIN